MVTQRAFSTDDEMEQITTTERVVDISRVAKVVKGGRHLSFRALVVVGDGNGHVSAGIGKADAIPDAVRKATGYAQRTLIAVPLTGSSIPHTVFAKFGAASVMLKPAPAGTGIIAGSSMRAVLELAGVKDVVAKSFKSQNPINVIHATLAALRDLTPLPQNGEGRSRPPSGSSPPQNGGLSAQARSGGPEQAAEETGSMAEPEPAQAPVPAAEEGVPS